MACKPGSTRSLGGRDVAAVEAEIKQKLPNSSVVQVAAVEEATAERAIAATVDRAWRVRCDRGPGDATHRGSSDRPTTSVGADDLDVLRALGATPEHDGG